MSLRPLLGNRQYDGLEANAAQAKCLKPWCNITVGLASFVVIALFVTWMVATEDKPNRSKPISEYSRAELLSILSNDDGYSDAALDDLVTDLPNLEGSYDFKQFSGYIEATNSRKIHYWFVEAVSDPDSAPLIMWTNGGPGCSGLLGMLTENGPFWAFPDLSLRANKYSWNEYANVVYLEQPYGVGFSIPENGKTGVVGDSAAVEDMDAALRSFITKFPKFQTNDLYISGESYGGHYIPRLALQILKNNNLESSTLKFKGFLLGNPYTDGYENEMGFMGALYGHGILKSNNYEAWMDTCWGNTDAMNTMYCDELYIVSYLEAYDMNVYALDYSNCPMDGLFIDNLTNETDGDSSMQAYSWKEHMKELSLTSQLTETYMAHYLVKRKIESMLEDNSIESKLQSLTKNDLISHLSKIETNIETNDGSPWIACSDYFTQRYLNLDDVKTAINVNESYHWAECSDAVFYGWPNKDWDNGMETVYHTLVNDYNIRMMIYSGDDDSVCGLQGTMYWLTRMGWVEDEDNSWEAWSVAKQLAGFYTRFLTTDGDVALHFQTIRSAGHMVPGTQPERAQELLYKFLYELDDD